MLTHPFRLFFPKTKTTKENIAAYYKKVAPFMLSFMRNRPVSLVRAPNGVGESKFYQRHPQEYFPAFIDRVKVESKQGSGVYICIDSYEDIEYLVNLGTIEFHVWQATHDKPNECKTMLFDLDPGAGVRIDQLREAARLLSERLIWEGYRPFIKTSGIKGFHVIVELKSFEALDAIRSDALRFARGISDKFPSLFTTEVDKEKRDKKIFIDYLRNAVGATNVAPWSVRATEIPAISVPFSWDEIDTVTPNKWTITDVEGLDLVARSSLWV